METVDTLISARWVIPIEPAARVLEHHAVAIRQGRIVALLPASEAARRYEARDRVDRPSHVLLPGFVNAHASASLALLRGGAGRVRGSRAAESGAPDPDWLDEDCVRDSTELAVARMIASGTTCFADTHVYPRVVARIAAAMQMRACVGLPLLERPTSWATTTDEYFEKASELRDAWRDDPLISTVFVTGTAAAFPDGTLQRLRRAADEIDLPVCMPLHESAQELQVTIALHGCRPVERLERLGLATPLLIGLHLTQLNAADIGIVARSGIQVVACPRFNLQRHAGICPLAELEAQGANLALGTGAAVTADLQGEFRLAALLAGGNGHAGLSVHKVLRMATLGGARALGLADTIGSIVPGKWADLCCVDMGVLQTQPLHDLSEQFVHAAEQDQVTDVWVAGRTLLGSGNLVRTDIAATVERASRWYS